MQKVKLKGKEIRRILAKKNLSQGWLAKRLEITSGYMAQLLNGDKCPSPETRSKIQNYFKEMTFEQLFSFIN
jgi:transcriptional regulator with XRE-family HTH domain